MQPFGRVLVSALLVSGVITAAVVAITGPPSFLVPENGQSQTMSKDSAPITMEAWDSSGSAPLRDEAPQQAPRSEPATATLARYFPFGDDLEVAKDKVAADVCALFRGKRLRELLIGWRTPEGLSLTIPESLVSQGEGSSISQLSSITSTVRQHNEVLLQFEEDLRVLISDRIRREYEPGGAAIAASTGTFVPLKGVSTPWGVSTTVEAGELTFYISLDLTRCGDIAPIIAEVERLKAVRRQDVEQLARK